MTTSTDTSSTPPPNWLALATVLTVILSVPAIIIGLFLGNGFFLHP